MDAQTMKRTITRIAQEIVEKNNGTDNLVIVGIQRRGFYLAQRLAEKIRLEDGIDIPVGSLDISFYKDDLSKINEEPIASNHTIKVSIDNKKVILVDDVLYTGKTIKTAIDSLMSIGKPNSIELAELIDRGHNELPIKSDYVGKKIETTKDEVVHVKMLEVDGTDEVVLSQIKTTILM